MDWHSYELGSAAINYSTKLARGLKLEGFIQDQQGQPLSGAKVSFIGPGINAMERENVSFHPRLSGVESDASGHFVTYQMPSHAELGMGLVASHPDFAPQWHQVAIPEGLHTNWLLVLNPGIALAGRVVDTNGWPICEAAVSVQEPHGGADVSAVTDVQGDFTMPHVPEGVARVKVTATGFKELERSLMAESNTPPMVLELQPTDTTQTAARQPNTMRLSGTVIDANSSEPIPQFKVLLDERRGISRRLIGEGHQGKFDWEIQLPFASEYTLEIDTDGYEPQVSTTRKRLDGDQVFKFLLNQGGLFVGRALQPDGDPAAGATVGLQVEGAGLHFEPPARLVNYGHPANETATDSQGMFSLKATAGMRSLLVVHETGCAALPAKGGTNLLVQLQAWGAIEGTLYIGKTPAAGETVDVGFQSRGYPPNAPRLPFDLMQKTDSAGRFRFDRVPPGDHAVYRYIDTHPGQTGEIGFSHGARVTVNPGEIAEVTLGGKGRVVIGRLVLPDAVNYDWSSKLVALVQDRPDLTRPVDNEFPPTSAYWEASRAYEAAIAKYYLRFQPDGSFRADDVSPGQYSLSLTITEPPADPLKENTWMYPGKVLDGITNHVVVPELTPEQNDTPLDLGTINVPMKAPQTDAHTARAR
jgi:protocatechuate 3,4-dioxygenase beta subunit